MGRVLLSFSLRYSIDRGLAHLHLGIVQIERVGQSACILPIHVRKGDKRGKLTSFYYFCKRQELGINKFGNKCIKKRGPGLIRGTIKTIKYAN